MTTCCSTQCEKRHECKKHCSNNIGNYPSENFYSFGSGSISSEGCKDTYWCGELGDYIMFEPIAENNIMKDYIEYEGKSYQVSTVYVDGLFETMIFPIENSIVSGKEVYCFRTRDLCISDYQHRDILTFPERYLSSVTILQYLKSKTKDFEEHVTITKKEYDELIGYKRKYKSSCSFKPLYKGKRNYR